MTFLQFTVAARPRPQGSKRAFVVKGKDGGKDRAVMVEQTAVKDFREAVRATAAPLVEATFEGPVRVVLAFALPKPKAAERGPRRYPIGRNSGDIEKLTRAVFDALTDAGVWRDDAQAVEVMASKDYPGTELSGLQTVPGVYVLLQPLHANEKPLTRPTETQGALPL